MPGKFIDVKTFFMFFYSCHVFAFLTYYILSTFFILKTFSEISVKNFEIREALLKPHKLINSPRFYYEGAQLIEHGFTSAPTQ